MKTKQIFFVAKFKDKPSYITHKFIETDKNNLFQGLVNLTINKKTFELLTYKNNIRNGPQIHFLNFE